MIQISPGRKKSDFWKTNPNLTDDSPKYEIEPNMNHKERFFKIRKK